MKTKNFMDALSAKELREVNGGYWEPPTFIDIFGEDRKAPWDIDIDWGGILICR